MGIERARMVLLVASVLGCTLASLAGASSHNSDCMKNPFANGCRGISAKRSALPSWAQLDAEAAGGDLYHLLTAPMQSSGWPAAGGPNQREMARLKVQQLVNAVELLYELTRGLGPLDQQRLVSSSGRRLCRELYALDGASEDQKRPGTSTNPKADNK